MRGSPPARSSASPGTRADGADWSVPPSSAGSLAAPGPRLDHAARVKNETAGAASFFRAAWRCFSRADAEQALDPTCPAGCDRRCRFRPADVVAVNLGTHEHFALRAVLAG